MRSTLLLLFTGVVLGAEIQLINKTPEHARYVNYLIKLSNDYETKVQMCWEPGTWDSQEKYNNVCGDFSPGEDLYFFTSVGDRWHAARLDTNVEVIVPIVGGKHIYGIRQYFEPISVDRDSIVYIRTPSECSDWSGYQTLGITWRDAARVAAFRYGMPVCMCGEFNASSSFTVDVPNLELPEILDGKSCKCDDNNEPAYDLWIPCNFVEDEPSAIFQHTDCVKQSAAPRHEDDTRLLLLHTTTSVDRLSLKNKMWESLKNLFGLDKASMIMPRAYWLEHGAQDLLDFREHCRDIVASGKGRELVFIMKNAYQHQQKGISMSSAQQLISNGLLTGDGVVDGFSMATEFLPRPFLVKGYKLNMRRYMVAVCSGYRLRGYVHNDGKNIYTKRPYREPWEGESWEGDRSAFDQRLEELITTGYVDENHYDDKALSGLELFDFAKSELGLDPSTLQQSMWTRLALTLHMSISEGGYHLCDVHRDHTLTENVPVCLENAVRFQHFGCDFHIDSNLTGYESRLFECNKGPDFSVHSYRDGKMKREVAADILTFIGLKGRFEGSAEWAREMNMNLIYDSDTFNPDEAFSYLESLQSVDIRLEKGHVPSSSSGLSSEVGNDEL